jgi:transketolase
VIDLYSIKPLDETTLREAATANKFIFTVEDHYPEGGIGEAVRSALAAVSMPGHSLAVRSKPKSGKPEELLNYQGIFENAIVKGKRHPLMSRGI